MLLRMVYQLGLEGPTKWHASKPAGGLEVCTCTKCLATEALKKQLSDAGCVLCHIVDTEHTLPVSGGDRRHINISQ